MAYNNKPIQSNHSDTTSNSNSAINALIQKIWNFLKNSSSLGLVSSILILFEIILNSFIINFIPYTEIDWSTYQQQIRIFQNGELDYTKIEGDTGPLVYPAGYLHVYSFLNSITKDGNDIRFAQYLFAGIYMFLTVIVFAIYRIASHDKSQSSKLPGYILVFLCLSKRIHSIFALRLFNDGIAMLFFYIGLLLMCRHRWTLGCLFYSIAVSVKMNLLLFAPALLLLLLLTFGIVRTIQRLFLIGAVQVLVALPFLIHHPHSYLSRAFEFSRQFMYKWTVNWRFIPEDIFLSKPLATLLLFLHLSILFLFAIKYTKQYGGIINLIKNSIKKPFSPPIITNNNNNNKNNNNPISLSPYYIVWVMFTCNLVGITFARSLHYQFYVWYFHSLPFLLWSTESIIPTSIKLICLLVTEYSWNTYPSTTTSSLLLFITNIILIISLFLSNTPNYLFISSNKIKKQK